ncbi:MAG: tRNA uridine-5-carboxymethylaminomethyl(34) synthesis GTPase MnmE [Roseibacillus sp.]|mgnify:FL=1|nr:tRNA uridine-5-carboxymethylaminomethyl(34) synthesis GTPase MnmE [Roseibacillus sp.]MCP4730917.1 tRNA uridine-5-carboxymethylaminomethyl(34) synthesis GTPase MnmE [Roseibacillus sp.]MDP7306535.1 tRNA uridine-5-carboxymethylaminomethyl(34) synthesis GTPase MnmE [Roseibacillus sp.]
MNETIAAVATPFGQGALAVIRLSGVEALPVAGQALGRAPEGLEERHAHRAKVCAENGVVLDDVVVTVFRGPRSYTGEDVVEISCHGGVLVVQRLLERLLECGARSAEAGEFTQRAFLNGKLDLTQAEAVMDVISAQTELALRAAQHQLGGRIGVETETLRGEVLEIVAHVEAHIDFPEENIDPDTGAGLIGRLEGVKARIDKLLATAEQGRILREGARTVICGEPNVGKSSLLNVLLGYERAIVSEVAGTTRDTVEEVLNVGGIPVRLIDTAGMRESVDEIEQRGVERTRQHLAEADLILEVVDTSREKGNLLSSESRENRHHLLVLNKSDLGAHPDWNQEGRGVAISCREGTGMDALGEAIGDQLSLGAASWGQEAVAVNARHQDCLRRAEKALLVAREQLSAGEGPELAAVDLRIALDAIGEVAGKVETEELLGEIFGRFCIGK